MGRLPDTFEDRKITQRVPYVMFGFVDITSSQAGVQFPSATFMHNSDKPFEIHRVIPRVPTVSTAEDTVGIISGPFGDEFISCRIFDFGRNQELMKASTPILNLIKSTAQHTWEWAEPYYLKKSQGFIVSIDSTVFNDSESSLRVAAAFQGYLISLAPERG